MSADRNEKTYYGIARTTEQLVSVVDVPNGIACNCYCPECMDTLVACANEEKKTYKQAAHFRHQVNKGCSGGAETVVHLLAKQILEEDCQIRLFIPESESVELETVDQVTMIVRPEFHDKISLSNVRSEVYVENLKPDIHGLAHINRTDQPCLICIEIRVSHACDDDKITKLKSKDLSTVEIDLRGLERHIADPGFRSLVRKAIWKKDNQKWLHLSDALKSLIPSQRKVVSKTGGKFGQKGSTNANDLPSIDGKSRFDNSWIAELFTYIELPIPRVLQIEEAGIDEAYIPEYKAIKELACYYSKPLRVDPHTSREYILRYVNGAMVSAIKLDKPLRASQIQPAYSYHIKNGIPFDKDNFILFTARYGRIENIYWRNTEIRRLYKELISNLDQRLRDVSLRKKGQTEFPY